LRKDVRLGVGDDCALLEVPDGQELAVSLDTLVAGVHFFADMDPEALGHRALAVNLSDLAAMGAEPAWASLALTLPQADPVWLAAFAGGFCALAAQNDLQLIGGDTTRGPLTITVQVQGLVPSGRAMRRSAARPGDLIYVTGTLGDASLALKYLAEGSPPAPDSDILRRLERPAPRLAEGRALRACAHAAIDVSDGLIADLGHILDASGVGAELRLGRLPLSEPVRAYVQASGDWALPLCGGDDYELCITVPDYQQGTLGILSKNFECGLHLIGRCTEKPGLLCALPSGEPWTPARSGYDHFADGP
jgi:thiamine-monophosphate kinase